MDMQVFRDGKAQADSVRDASLQRHQEAIADPANVLNHPIDDSKEGMFDLVVWAEWLTRVVLSGLKAVVAHRPTSA